MVRKTPFGVLYALLVVGGLYAVMIVTFVADMVRAIWLLGQSVPERRNARRLSFAQYQRNARALSGNSWFL